MEVPISLYLKTQQGEHPDLKVAARSAIIFAEIIEAVTRSIDPDLQVRVEIVSGSEGSLGLNTLNKIVTKTKAKAEEVKQGILAGWNKHEKARFLAIYVAASILDNTASWGFNEFIDWMKSDDAPEEVRQLSDDKLKSLAVEIAAELRRNPAQDQVQRLYSQVAKDERISGIGVTSKPRPAKQLLPRSEFTDEAVEPDDQDRVTIDRFEATLISPVLEIGERRWKLRGPFGEFGAAIKDKAFLHSAIVGDANLALRGGIILDIEVARHERMVDGVWEIQLRTVEKVHSWREGPLQGDLMLSGS